MKNKKTLKILAAVIPLCLIGLLVYLFYNFQKKKEKTDALKNAPAFHLTTIDGGTFTQENLAEDQIKIILYFSPECHFCQSEAKELSTVYDQYQNIQWIWVASEPLNEIKEFARKYNLDTQSNMYWCHDEMAVLYQKLGIKTVPYILVYDKNNQLIRRNAGAIKIEKLLTSFDEKK